MTPRVDPLPPPTPAQLRSALDEQLARFAALGPRRPGEHRCHRERAQVRLDEAAVAVGLAPWVGPEEAQSALQLAKWAINDVAGARRAAERRARANAAERCAMDELEGDPLPIAAE